MQSRLAVWVCRKRDTLTQPFTEDLNAYPFGVVFFLLRFSALSSYGVLSFQPCSAHTQETCVNAYTSPNQTQKTYSKCVDMAHKGKLYEPLFEYPSISSGHRLTQRHHLLNHSDALLRIIRQIANFPLATSLVHTSLREYYIRSLRKVVEFTGRLIPSGCVVATTCGNIFKGSSWLNSLCAFTRYTYDDQLACGNVRNVFRRKVKLVKSCQARRAIRCG